MKHKINKFLIFFTLFLSSCSNINIDFDSIEYVIDDEYQTVMLEDLSGYYMGKVFNYVELIIKSKYLDNSLLFIDEMNYDEFHVLADKFDDNISYKNELKSSSLAKLNTYCEQIEINYKCRFSYQPIVKICKIADIRKVNFTYLNNGSKSEKEMYAISNCRLGIFDIDENLIDTVELP